MILFYQTKFIYLCVYFAFLSFYGETLTLCEVSVLPAAHEESFQGLLETE